jgi:hypothetical protein
VRGSRPGSRHGRRQRYRESMARRFAKIAERTDERPGSKRSSPRKQRAALTPRQRPARAIAGPPSDYISPITDAPNVAKTMKLTEHRINIGTSSRRIILHPRTKNPNARPPLSSKPPVTDRSRAATGAIRRPAFFEPLPQSSMPQFGQALTAFSPFSTKIATFGHGPRDEPSHDPDSKSLGWCPAGRSGRNDYATHLLIVEAAHGQRS